MAAPRGRPRACRAPVLNRAFTRFRLPWTWDGQPGDDPQPRIDETGYVQPASPT